MAGEGSGIRNALAEVGQWLDSTMSQENGREDGRLPEESIRMTKDQIFSEVGYNKSGSVVFRYTRRRVYGRQMFVGASDFDVSSVFGSGGEEHGDGGKVFAGCPCFFCLFRSRKCDEGGGNGV